MATNEQGLDIDSELEEPEEILDENGTDTTDWKAEALKNYGKAKRYQSDVKKYKLAEAERTKAEAEKAKQSQDKKDFDYAEKSYLLSNGIKKEEIPFVWEQHQKSGRSIDDILDSKFFQNELKEKRELQATEEATPSGTKRSGGSARDSVEYWLAKGQLPPPDQPELRRKVVNTKIATEQARSQFTSKPIA
jgi:hypothetical protein